MAWFVERWCLVVCRYGHEDRRAERHRPWYPKTVPTFADMLSCCRLAMWECWWKKRSDKRPAKAAPEEWLLSDLWQRQPENQLQNSSYHSSGSRGLDVFT